MKKAKNNLHVFSDERNDSHITGGKIRRAQSVHIYIVVFAFATIFASVLLVSLRSSDNGTTKNEEGLYVLPDGSTSVFDEEETNELNKKFVEDNPDFLPKNFDEVENDDGNVQ